MLAIAISATRSMAFFALISISSGQIVSIAKSETIHCYIDNKDDSGCSHHHNTSHIVKSYFHEPDGSERNVICGQPECGSGSVTSLNACLDPTCY